MKSKSLLGGVFAAALFFGAVVAQDAPAPELTPAQARTADRLIDAGLEDERAWEILESLTTEIGPRLAGSDDEARARVGRADLQGAWL